MNTYSTGAIRQALQAIDVVPGDTICVHSALFPLGRLGGVSVRDIPRGVTDVLLDYLGPEGTLVVPTFNFDFCAGVPFDRQHTPSQMGSLSEHIRQRPESQRSPHPMQSVAAIGALAESLCTPDPSSAFRGEGPFEQLRHRDAKLVLFGATIQAASLLHCAEVEHTVPYRYWKVFEGVCIDRGVRQRKAYQRYVRDLSVNPRLVLAPIEMALRADGLYREASLGAGVLQACRFKDFHYTVLRMLEKDVFCLIENRDEVVPHYA